MVETIKKNLKIVIDAKQSCWAAVVPGLTSSSCSSLNLKYEDHMLKIRLRLKRHFVLVKLLDRFREAMRLQQTGFNRFWKKWGHQTRSAVYNSAMQRDKQGRGNVTGHLQTNVKGFVILFNFSWWIPGYNGHNSARIPQNAFPGLYNKGEVHPPFRGEHSRCGHSQRIHKDRSTKIASPFIKL